MNVYGMNVYGHDAAITKSVFDSSRGSYAVSKVPVEEHGSYGVSGSLESPSEVLSRRALVELLEALIELQPKQDELLDQIVGGPLISNEELQTLGILPPLQGSTALPIRTLG